MKTELKSNNSENSLAVQWLELCASNAGLERQSLVGELRSDMPYNSSNNSKAIGQCEGDLGSCSVSGVSGRPLRGGCGGGAFTGGSLGEGEHRLRVLWDWMLEGGRSGESRGQGGPCESE